MLACLAARLGHGRGVERVVSVAIRREVERHAVGAPADVALAALAFGHAAGRALVVDAAHEHVAVGHDGHRLAVGRKRCIAHALADLLDLAVAERVVGGGEGELLRLRAFLREIDAEEIAEHAEHRGLAVARNREAVDVVGGEIGQALARVGRLADARAVQVVRAGATVGEIHVLVGGDPTRHAVVAVVLGQLREGLGRGIEHPHVVVVGAVVAAAHPAHAAALEDDLRAVGRNARRGAERIMQARRHAAFERQHKRPRRAEEIALDRAVDEDRRLAAEHADRRQRERGVELGQALEVAAIGRDRPEVPESVALALEHDARAIGAERAARLDRGARGQAHGSTAIGRRAPEIAAPGEGHPRAIGRERGVARKVDLGRERNGGAAGGDGDSKDSARAAGTEGERRKDDGGGGGSVVHGVPRSMPRRGAQTGADSLRAVSRSFCALGAF